MNKFPVVKLQKRGLAENRYRSGNNSWAAANLV